MAIRVLRSTNTFIDRYEVDSHSDPNKHYTVALSARGVWECSCPIWIYKRKQCKHIDEVLNWKASTARTPTTPTKPRPKPKPTPVALTPIEEEPKRLSRKELEDLENELDIHVEKRQIRI